MGRPTSALFYRRRLDRLIQILTEHANGLVTVELDPFWTRRAHKSISDAWQGLTGHPLELGRRLDFMSAIDTGAARSPRTKQCASDVTDAFIAIDDPELNGKFDLGKVSALLDAWASAERGRRQRGKARPARKWRLLAEIWREATGESVGGEAFRKEWQRELKRRAGIRRERADWRDEWLRAFLSNPD
jgi:hypothetical protein